MITGPQPIFPMGTARSSTHLLENRTGFATNGGSEAILSNIEALSYILPQEPARSTTHFLGNRTGVVTVNDGSEAILSNLEPQQSEVLAAQLIEDILGQWRHLRAERLRLIQERFKQRFEADRNFFEGIDARKIDEIVNVMAQQMLIYWPTQISADVTPDASVIFQAHYGPLHFYWECFFDKEEENLYATLNITQNKKVVFSKGGDFINVQHDFITIITPLFKLLFKQSQK